MEILDRVASGNIIEGDFVRLQDVGWTMTEASLCGLGQTAASALLSAMKLWPELFAVGQTSKMDDAAAEAKIKKAKDDMPVVKKPVINKPKVTRVKPKLAKTTTATKNKKSTVKKK